MIYNIVMHVAIYFLRVLPVELAGVILLPLILPFIGKDKERLPTWCRWFDNHELALEKTNGHRDVDGLLGPTAERIKMGALNADGTENPDFSAFKRFLYRYRWIGLRNPAYYYKYVTLGWYVINPVVTTTKGDLEYSNPMFYEVGDKYDDRDGWYYTEVTDCGNTYFELYICKTYGKRPGKGLRLRMGHKIGDPSKDLHKGKMVQWEFAPNPIMHMD